MIGNLVLILRVVLALVLYGFLGLALYTLWKDLRQQSALLTRRQIPNLIITWQTGREKEVRQYTSPDITIGRDPTTDCPIPDDTISSRHARLSYHHNQWWGEDLHSTNGTFLNQEQLDIPTVIVSGDELRCGQVNLVINIQDR